MTGKQATNTQRTGTVIKLNNIIIIITDQADKNEVSVLLLYKSSDGEIAEQISAICNAVGTDIILYSYEFPWKEKLVETLSTVSIVIAVVGRDFFKYAISVFLSGYILGRDMPLILYKKNRYKLPGFFNTIPSTGELRYLTGILTRELEKSEGREIRQDAIKALKEMGFPLTHESFIKTVKEGEILAVEQFLKSAFSPDLEDENGVPLLCLATRNKHRAVVHLLLQWGADINVVSMDRGNTPLMDAAAEGDVDLVKDLLEAGSSVDVKSKAGQTALILAVGQKNEEIARILIEAGASVNEEDSLGMSAEKYARLFKLSKVIDLIEQRSLS